MAAMIRPERKGLPDWKRSRKTVTAATTTRSADETAITMVRTSHPPRRGGGAAGASGSAEALGSESVRSGAMSVWMSQAEVEFALRRAQVRLVGPGAPDLPAV